MHKGKGYLIEKPTQDITNIVLSVVNNNEVVMTGCCFLKCRFAVMRCFR